jgi:hypothetical protein
MHSCMTFRAWIEDSMHSGSGLESFREIVKKSRMMEVERGFRRMTIRSRFLRNCRCSDIIAVRD